MKPNDYVKKHNLNVINHVLNKEQFFIDLTKDFDDLIEETNMNEVDTLFDFDKKVISKLRQKYSSINAKTIPCLPDNLWDEFQNSIIDKKVNELFN